MKNFGEEIKNKIRIDFGSTSFNAITEDKYKELKKTLGISTSKINFFNAVVPELVKPDEKIVDFFGGDFTGITPGVSLFWERDNNSKERYKDNFGVVWEKVGIYYEKKIYPLKNIDVNSFNKINYKDELDSKILKDLESRIKNIYKKDNKYIVFQYPALCGLISTAINLRGMEEIYMDFYINRNFYHKLLNNLLEIFINFYNKVLNKIGMYIQVIAFKDDLGSQKSELISKDTYIKFIKPYHKKLFEAIRSKTDALIFYHSDGSIANLIPELIDAGIDILNPIQTSAKNMDIIKLDKEFGKDLIFWGGIDEQQLLLSKDEKYLEVEVNKILSHFSSKGGYVFSPSHIVQIDVPVKNLIKVYEIAKKYK